MSVLVHVGVCFYRWVCVGDRIRSRLHLHMCVRTRVYVWENVCSCLHLHNMWVCLFMFIATYLLTGSSVCMCMYVNVFVHVCTYMCVNGLIRVCVCVQANEYVCSCLCLRVCERSHMCVCVCMFVRMCMFAQWQLLIHRTVGLDYLWRPLVTQTYIRTSVHVLRDAPVTVKGSNGTQAPRVPTATQTDIRAKGFTRHSKYSVIYTHETYAPHSYASCHTNIHC